MSPDLTILVPPLVLLALLSPSRSSLNLVVSSTVVSTLFTTSGTFYSTSAMSSYFSTSVTSSYLSTTSLSSPIAVVSFT